MTRARRRSWFWFGFWSIAWALAFVARRVLVRVLASQDPIAEVLLGHAGTALPLVGLVLFLQLASFVVLPSAVGFSLVGLLLADGPLLVRRMGKE